MKVSLGGRSVRTRVQIINDGQNGVFAIPLASIVPIDGPLTIEIFEEDTLSADDLVVRMIWALPGIHELRNSNSLKGADYRVAVKFDR